MGSFLGSLTLGHGLCVVALSGVLGGSALAMAPSPNQPAQADPPAAPLAAPPPEVQPPVATEEIPVPETGPPAPEPQVPSAEVEALALKPVEPALDEAEETGQKQADAQAKRAKKAKAHKRSRDEHGGDGPPPWAPAHGYRCKAAGNAPGTAAFKQCIKSRKSGRADP